MKTGVLFDMDGVLVASGPAHAASWRIVAKKHGCTVSDDEFRQTFGRTSREIIRMLFGEVTDAQVHQIDSEKELAYRDLVSGMVPLMIGCREVLGSLSAAGYPLAVATSGPPENLDLVLRETGIGGYFRATVNGFDVKHGKPAPDVFLLAAERIDVPPAGCVVIEDAPVGIEAAKAAGMKVIALVGTHPAIRLSEARPTQIVDHLGDITPQLVRSVLSS